MWIIIILIYQAIVCGALAGKVADKKGHSSGAWFAAGFFFGIFGLIAAAGLPFNTTVTSTKEIQMTEKLKKEPKPVGDSPENY